MAGIDEFLPLLTCPDCRVGLQFEPCEGGHGWLRCTRCTGATPVLSGMVLFTETRFGASDAPGLEALAESLAGTDALYEEYSRDKFRREVMDPYAAFEPFNESNRCATPLLRAVQGRIGPGEAILDLGIRSGWSAAMLAESFPLQKVVSICWSGSGVLGYRGFRQWFAGARQAPNLLIVFSPMDKPLPVRDGAFSVVHSHDCLHRCPDETFLDKSMAAGRPDAVLLHAHVHLSDAQPEPFFERGGTLRSMEHYRWWLASRLAGDPRTGLVLPETPLYLAIRSQDLRWSELESSPGYNGFVVVSTPELREQATALCLQGSPPDPDARILVNPLLRINPLTGEVRVDPTSLGGRAMEMLARHPPFARRLREHLPATIDAMGIELLRLGESGATIGEVVLRLREPLETVTARMASLAQEEIILVAKIPLSYHHLYRFHSNLRSVFDRSLARVLVEWAAQSPGAPGGELMGSEIDRGEALQVLAALLRYFRKIGVAADEPVEFLATAPDALWPLVACLLLGAKPSPEGNLTHRLAVTNRPGGRWPQELSVCEDACSGVTLAKVLATYVDADDASDAGLCDAADSTTSDWFEFVTLDAQGRLSRRARGEG